MLSKYSSILICLLSFVLNVSAQTKYNFKHITIKDGLSDGKISDFAQDKYGNIWMGSYGLDRYNGYTMQHYTSDPADTNSLPDMNVRRLFCSRSGNLYVSTFTGFCVYDYVHNNFKRYPFGVNANDTRIFEAGDGQLWMNSTKGLVIVNEKNGEVLELKKNPDTLIRQIANYHVFDFAADKKNNIYLATRAGLFIVNCKTWQVKHFTHDEKNASSIISDDVQNVVIDEQGIAWLSTGYYASSLERFDPSTGIFSHYDQFYTKRKEWADNRILDLLLDSKNRLWIATLRGSLALYNREKNDFDFFLYDRLNSATVASHTIFVLFEDRDGGIWLSSHGSGADYFLPNNNFFTTLSVSSFQSPPLIDNWCQSIAEDRQGNLWIGTYRGLSFYDRKANTFKNYFLAQQQSREANNSIRSLLADDDGRIWIGTGNGLNRWDPATQKILPVNEADSIPAAFMNYLMMDRQKNIWACSPRGLFRYNRQTGKFENLFKRPEFKNYKNNGVFSFYQDQKGRYWISLSLTGILVYDEKKKSVEFFNFKRLNEKSIAYDYITSFAEDAHGVMWLSSYYGLISFDYEKKKIGQYDKDAGLPSNKTSELLIDSLDRIWIGTTNGLCMLDTDRKKFHRFDEKDGLATHYFYEGAAYKLHTGEFACPTYSGVVLFNPSTVHISASSQTNVMIESFKVLGKEVYTGQPIQELKQINLKPDQNFLTIELSGLNYPDPQKIKYAYKLDGFNDNWIYTNERIISFTNIPGGKYTFHYKAAVDIAEADTVEHQMTIFIGTVFYKTWWFISLIALLTAGIVYSLVRYRFAQQQKLHLLQSKAQLLEKEKALVMYENLKQHLNPHFLFNSLTSLRSLIRVDQKNAGDFLEKMSKIYRYILKSRDSELVQLKDEINFVQTYIELQQTRFRKGLQVKFNISDDFLFRKIVPVTLQNLIDNAIKHNLVDEEAPLVIAIYVQDDHLVVRNNLQKKEFVETSNKQGLQSMRSLYKYLDPRPVLIQEDKDNFIIKIPLI